MGKANFAMTKQHIAIGLMSGTSMDGVDAALIYTDGETVSRLGPSITMPYDEDMRGALRAALEEASQASAPSDGSGDMQAVRRRLTDVHADAVQEIIDLTDLCASQIDVIGFHGHTVTHRPDRGWTWQIGNGGRLAGRLGIPVINDFRTADMHAGGQGAPLVPLYHAALLRRAGVKDPVAILNIGGVANVTWVDMSSGDDIPPMVAFDTGPGGALLDDWVQAHTDQHYDEDGALAARGSSHQDVLLSMMNSPYFDDAPPKSLDRDDFSMQLVRGLSVADGASTLTDFVVDAVVVAQAHFPKPVSAWYVCGGGRLNATLMRRLSSRLSAHVATVDRLGWRGDAVEAEAFGYLAVRSLLGMATSLPGTTGCSKPVIGGSRHDPL